MSAGEPVASAPATSPDERSTERVGAGGGPAASPLAPLRPTRGLLAVPVALAVAFALLVGLRLHGFSISIWRQWTDLSAPKELLLGRPQAIRIDDYAVILPLVLAQERHDPPFPVVNTLIGQGQNMLVPFSVPVWHPITLFRPDTFGFFLGPDVGMAWRWWSRAFGLFGAAWLLLLVVTRGDRALSAAGALLLVESPFFQFWGLRSAPVALHACLLVVAALVVAFARRPRWILLAGLVLGYSAVAFFLALYPPYQVPLAYLGLLVFGGLVFAHRGALDLRAHAGWRAGALLLAAGIAAAGVALLFHGAGDAIARMSETVYPGHRVSLGGNRSVPDLLAATAGVPFLTDRYGHLVNACEAAGFWLLSPVLVAASLGRSLAARRRPDPVALALFAGWAALVLHATTTMPVWLAQASLWSRVPGHRSVIALGLAEVLLLARLLSHSEPLRGPARAGLAVLWGAAVLVCGARLSQQLPALPLGGVLGFAAASAVLAWLALAPPRPWLAMAAVAAASCTVSAWFNPLVRGGSEALQGNELARAVAAVDAAYEGKSVWVAFGNLGLGNLFRAVGVHSINGVHPVPQLELWKAVDPDASGVDAYNRYAHVLFTASASERPTFDSTSPDAFRVSVDPSSPALAKLGVTHIVVGSLAARRRAELGGAVWVGSAGPYQLMREPWAPAGAGEPAPGAGGPP